MNALGTNTVIENMHVAVIHASEELTRQNNPEMRGVFQLQGKLSEEMRLYQYLCQASLNHGRPHNPEKYKSVLGKALEVFQILKLAIIEQKERVLKPILASFNSISRQNHPDFKEKISKLFTNMVCFLAALRTCEERNKLVGKEISVFYHQIKENGGRLTRWSLLGWNTDPTTNRDAYAWTSVGLSTQANPSNVMEDIPVYEANSNKLHEQVTEIVTWGQNVEKQISPQVAFLGMNLNHAIYLKHLRTEACNSDESLQNKIDSTILMQISQLEANLRRLESTHDNLNKAKEVLQTLKNNLVSNQASLQRPLAQLEIAIFPVEILLDASISYFSERLARFRSAIADIGCPRNIERSREAATLFNPSEPGEIKDKIANNNQRMISTHTETMQAKLYEAVKTHYSTMYSKMHSILTNQGFLESQVKFLQHLCTTTKSLRGEHTPATYSGRLSWILDEFLSIKTNIDALKSELKIDEISQIYDTMSAVIDEENQGEKAQSLKEWRGCALSHKLELLAGEKTYMDLLSVIGQEISIASYQIKDNEGGLKRICFNPFGPGWNQDPTTDVKLYDWFSSQTKEDAFEKAPENQVTIKYVTIDGCNREQISAFTQWFQKNSGQIALRRKFLGENFYQVIYSINYWAELSTDDEVAQGKALVASHEQLEVFNKNLTYFEGVQSTLRGATLVLDKLLEKLQTVASSSTDTVQAEFYEELIPIKIELDANTAYFNEEVARFGSLVKELTEKLPAKRE